MKKLLLLGALCVSSLSFSQSESFFRTDGGLGGAFTAGNFKAYGIAVSTEPKFFFNDNISVGVHLEGDVLFGGRVLGSEDEVSVGLSTRVAYLAKGEYYFGQGNTKPFVGLMAGMYTQANIGTATNDNGAGVTMSAVRTFGFAPQVGFAFGNFRLSGIYHFVPQKTLVEMNTSVGGVESIEVSNSYFVIQMGFRVFGINDK